MRLFMIGISALSLASLLPACARTVAGIPVTGPGARLISLDYQSELTRSGKRYRITTANGTVLTRHQGVDFAAPVGTAVLSASHGRVAEVSPGRHCGGRVVVVTDIEDGTAPLPGRFLHAYYIHVVPAAGLEPGEAVSPGQVIGAVQDPRDVAGYRSCIWSPHLHLQLARGGLRRHTNPHEHWAGGAGYVTCYREGMQVPAGKLVVPLAC